MAAHIWFKDFFSYDAKSGDLVFRHSLKFLPNCRNIACWMAEFNAVLCFEARARKWNVYYFIISLLMTIILSLKIYFCYIFICQLQKIIYHKVLLTSTTLYSLPSPSHRETQRAPRLWSGFEAIILGVRGRAQAGRRETKPQIVSLLPASYYHFITIWTLTHIQHTNSLYRPHDNHVVTVWIYIHLIPISY